jgi:cytochrome c-type biogenesis protein CcmH/NrfG
MLRERLRLCAGCGGDWGLAPEILGIAGRLVYLGALQADKLHDLRAAERLLQTAVTLAPRFSDAHVALGKVLALEGRTSEALASWESALELAPQNAELAGLIEWGRRRLLSELDAPDSQAEQEG